jgi:hypothetical protein
MHRGKLAGFGRIIDSRIIIFKGGVGRTLDAKIIS